jgi:hypothetical protein
MELRRRVLSTDPDAPESAVPDPDPLLAMGLEGWADDLANPTRDPDEGILKLTTEWPTP